jgi:hypothetical protein
VTPAFWWNSGTVFQLKGKHANPGASHPSTCQSIPYVTRCRPTWRSIIIQNCPSLIWSLRSTWTIDTPSHPCYSVRLSCRNYTLLNIPVSFQPWCSEPRNDSNGSSRTWYMSATVHASAIEKWTGISCLWKWAQLVGVLLTAHRLFMSLLRQAWLFWKLFWPAPVHCVDSVQLPPR